MFRYDESAEKRVGEGEGVRRFLPEVLRGAITMRFQMAVCVLLALGPVAELVACSCPPPPPPKKALEFSTAVCFAEVTGVETAGQERTVKLKVERWWKGGDAAEVTVSTSKSDASCGYGFEKGKTVSRLRPPGRKTKDATRQLGAVGRARRRRPSRTATSRNWARGRSRPRPKRRSPRGRMALPPSQ